MSLKRPGTPYKMSYQEENKFVSLKDVTKVVNEILDKELSRDQDDSYRSSDSDDYIIIHEETPMDFNSWKQTYGKYYNTVDLRLGYHEYCSSEAFIDYFDKLDREDQMSSRMTK